MESAKRHVAGHGQRLSTICKRKVAFKCASTTDAREASTVHDAGSQSALVMNDLMLIMREQTGMAACRRRQPEQAPES